MVKTAFLIWSVIGQGWQIMKKNMWQLLGLQVGLVLLFCLAYGLVELLLPDAPSAAWYFRLSNLVATTLLHECLSVGILTLSLQFADGFPVKFTDFFSKMHRVLVYFAASVLSGLAALLGLICFIVPGIIIFTRFSFIGYLIIDKNMGVFQAMKESWYLVKGLSGRVFGFWLATALVIFAGALCLGVGLLFAVPTTCIASGLLYRRLLKDNIDMNSIER